MAAATLAGVTAIAVAQGAPSSESSKLKLSAKPSKLKAGKKVTLKATGNNRRQGFVTTYVDSRNRPCRASEGAERARGAGVKEVSGPYTGVPDAPEGKTNKFSFTYSYKPRAAGKYRFCSYLGKIAERAEARAQAVITVSR